MHGIVMLNRIGCKTFINTILIGSQTPIVLCNISIRSMGIARGRGDLSPSVRSSAPPPLSPPNEMTLCSGVYGEPPFKVPVSPPPPPSLLAAPSI